MPHEPQTTPCQHERLGFGSGGFYVICHFCHQMWIARKEGDVFDYERSGDKLGMWDVREKEQHS